MKIKEPVRKPKNFGYVKALAKILPPIFNIAFYVLILSMLLLVVLTVVIFFVNVNVSDMLLPPFMHAIHDKEGAVTAYDIILGNGVKIRTLYEHVTLSDIKTVLYSGIAVLFFIFMTLAPIFKFLAQLLKTMGSGDVFNPKNALHMIYIGMTVLGGYVTVSFISRFYNFYLISRFVKDAPQTFSLSLGIDLFSGMVGLLIMLFGAIYGYVCHAHNNGEIVPKGDKDKDNDDNNKLTLLK